MDGVEGAADPFAMLDVPTKRVVAALRGRHRGASVASLVADTELATDSVSACLRALEESGLVEHFQRPVASFHLPERVETWELSRSAWAALRWMPTRLAVEPSGHQNSREAELPVELWPSFWSGQRPESLRFPRDAERACEALLQSPMPEAQIWAMLHLPADILLSSRHAHQPLLRWLAAANR